MVVPMSRGIDAGLGDRGAGGLDAEIDRRDLREGAAIVDEGGAHAVEQLGIA